MLLYTVGLKGNVSEAEHPLLCEGTRRQKGELAVAMLVQYKDDTTKLARVSTFVFDIPEHSLRFLGCQIMLIGDLAGG